MQWCLYHDQSPEFRAVILYKEPALLVFANVCVKSADRNIVNSNVCVVSSSKPYFVCAIEVDNVKLFLFFGLWFWLVYLKSLDNKIIALWLSYFKDLMGLLIVNEMVLQLMFAQFAMKSFPNVRCYMWCHFLVLVATKPMPQAVEMYKRHGSRTLARGNQWVTNFFFFKEANPAHFLIFGIHAQVIVYFACSEPFGLINVIVRCKIKRCLSFCLLLSRWHVQAGNCWSCLHSCVSDFFIFKEIWGLWLIWIFMVKV